MSKPDYTAQFATQSADQLAERLHAAADTLSPDHSVSAAQVLEQGHRRLRRRRATGVATGIAAVALVGAALPSLVSGQPTTTAPAMATGSPAPTAGSTSANDPLTVTADFGWLPAQLNVVTYESTPAPDSVYRENDTAAPRIQADQSRYIGVSLMTGINSGQRPLSTTGMTNIGTIDGHPAYERVQNHLPGLAPESVAIIFQSPVGKVVNLQVEDLSPADAEKIARNVHFATRSVPLPLRWTGLGISPARAGGAITTVNGNWADVELDVAIANHVVAIAATPADTPVQVPSNAASKTVDGVRVTVQPSDPSGSLQTLADPDLKASLSYTGTGPAPVFSDPQTLLRYITPLGPSPTAWTTDVVQP